MRRLGPGSARPALALMREHGVFFLRFLRHARRLNSLMPSSRWLSRAMADDIDFDQAATILELGPGTGAVTAVLSARMGPRARLVAVELDPVLAEYARRRFGGDDRVTILRGDALRLDEVLAAACVGRGAVDYVVSTLPIPAMPDVDQGRVLHLIKSYLRPDGGMSVITHWPYVFRRVYRPHFDSVRFRWEPRGVPPSGGVYYCRNIRA